MLNVPIANQIGAVIESSCVAVVAADERGERPTGLKCRNTGELPANGNFIPPGRSDPSCAACPGWVWARAAYDAYHEAERGERVDLRTWRRRFVQDNEFVGRCKQNVWQDWYA